MIHNAQIIVYGSCRCKCHQGRRGCDCGAAAFFNEPIKSRKPKKLKLDSRVKAFQKSRGNVMHVVKQDGHGFHGLRIEHPEGLANMD